MSVEHIDVVKEIYDIEPLCTKRFGEDLWITRVPWGWIFSRSGIQGSDVKHFTETFVPYDTEFKDL